MRIHRESGEYKSILRNAFERRPPERGTWLSFSSRRVVVATVVGTIGLGGGWALRLYSATYISGPRFLDGGSLTAGSIAFGLGSLGASMTVATPFFVSWLSHRPKSFRRGALALMFSQGLTGLAHVAPLVTLPVAIATSFGIALFGFREGRRGRLIALVASEMLGVTGLLTNRTFVVLTAMLLCVPLVGLADQIERTRVLNFLPSFKRSQTRRYAFVLTLLTAVLLVGSYATSSMLFHPKEVKPGAFAKLYYCQGTTVGRCPARVAHEAQVDVAWLSPSDRFPYYGFLMAPTRRRPVLLVYQVLDSADGNKIEIVTDPTNRFPAEKGRSKSFRLEGLDVTATASDIDPALDPNHEYNYVYYTFEWIRGGIHYRMSSFYGPSFVPPPPPSLSELAAIFLRIKYQSPGRSP